MVRDGRRMELLLSWFVKNILKKILYIFKSSSYLAMLVSKVWSSFRKLNISTFSSASDSPLNSTPNEHLWNFKEAPDM